MTFRIIDRQWKEVFQRNAEAARQQSLIISPFLRRTVLENLLGDKPRKVRVLTRFNLAELLNGASDIKALEYLLEIGAKVKGIKHLHSKVYIFGASKVIITSANLTQAALSKNAEFGVESTASEFVQEATVYFESLWEKAGSVLDASTLARWKRRISKAARSYVGPTSQIGLGDQGTDLGFEDGSEMDHLEAAMAILPSHWFIKFFGTSNDRASRDLHVLEEVKDSACHKVLSYPTGKRPRQVRDGDLIFIGQLVNEPNDIMIFGRALGMKHNPQTDNATTADIRKRKWRRDWSHYVRVTRTEFVNGRLRDCVSLYALMHDLGYDSFASTYANALQGSGNTDPRKAYLRQASVRLTSHAAQILAARLEDVFSKFGRLPDKELDKID